MIVKCNRLVVSQGPVKNQGDFHIVNATTTNPAVSGPQWIPPVTARPLQQVWWTPFANLPDLGEFRLIGVRRAAINDWNRYEAVVRTDLNRAAKIAVLVYGVDAARKTVSGGSESGEYFTLHSNPSAAATVTLPDARRGMQGTEVYFQVGSNNPLTIVAGAGDQLRNAGSAITQAESAAQGDRLVIKWAANNVWRVSEENGAWSFT